MASTKKTSKKGSKKTTPQSTQNAVSQDMFNSLLVDSAQHNIPLNFPQHNYPTQNYPQHNYPTQNYPQQTFGFARYSGTPPNFGYQNFGYQVSQPNVGTPTGSSQQDPESVKETQFDDEDEEERETPDSAKKGKRAKVMWSNEETRILAECWSRASQNCIVGNSQSSGNFWATVRTEYNELVREPRRQDQLTGKWSKMNKDIKTFIGIYDKFHKMWQSGANDNDVMKQAKKHFHLQTGKTFVYEDAWEVLKDLPQFLTYDGFNPKRREPEPIDLEDSDPTPIPNTGAPNLDHLFKQDPIRRPRGRDSSKSARNSYSSDAASHFSSEEARARVIDSAKDTSLTMAEIRKEAQIRTKFDGLRLLSQPVSTDIPQDQYDLVMRYRSKITKQYYAELSDEDK